MAASARPTPIGCWVAHGSTGSIPKLIVRKRQPVLQRSISSKGAPLHDGMRSLAGAVGGLHLRAMVGVDGICSDAGRRDDRGSYSMSNALVIGILITVALLAGFYLGVADSHPIRVRLRLLPMRAN